MGSMHSCRETVLNIAKNDRLSKYLDYELMTIQEYQDPQDEDLNIVTLMLQFQKKNKFKSIQLTCHINIHKQFEVLLLVEDKFDDVYLQQNRKSLEFAKKNSLLRDVQDYCLIWNGIQYDKITANLLDFKFRFLEKFSSLQ